MNNKGQTLIELLITIALASILIPALLTGFFVTREGRAQSEQRLLATAYLKEAQEAVKIVHSNGWENLVNGTFHPSVLGTTWTLSGGQEIIGNFTRTIEISDANRDSNGEIVDIGGIPDPSTKEIEISVSWGSPIPTDVSSRIYLSRFKNSSFIHTTQEDFEGGVLDGVIVINENGGEVTLGAGGGGTWCDPNLSIQSVNLPKQGVANAISAIEGNVFAGTGENASGISYASVGIDNLRPPNATISGTFDGYKTNDVYGEENYAYLATDTNQKEIVVIDLTSTTGGKYQEAGYFNAPGNLSASSVYVSGNVGFVTTTDGKLYSFDLSNKSGSRPLIDSDGVALAGNGTGMIVVGNFAYISIANTTSQLQIVDIGNPSNLTISGSASVAGGAGQAIFVNTSGTRAYLATAESSTQREFFIIDVETKTGSRPTIGSYEANGMSPKGITVVPGGRAILVGTGGQEYQVINITNEANPVGCGGLNIDTGVRGVSSVLESDGDAYSYIITGDANAELKIIEGGPGGSFTGSGVFESNFFDATTSVAYNRITPIFTLPPQTSLEFQVAVSMPPDGNCASAPYHFVGPDGTTNTRFSGEGGVPLVVNGQGYENPGRCFKYKAIFETNDPLLSPILTDVLINYSF